MEDKSLYMKVLEPLQNIRYLARGQKSYSGVNVVDDYVVLGMIERLAKEAEGALENYNQAEVQDFEEQVLGIVADAARDAYRGR